MPKPYQPTEDDIKAARDFFTVFEPNDRHYQAMMNIITPALSTLPDNPSSDKLDRFRGQWILLVAAWNKQAYRGKYDAVDHFLRTEEALFKHWAKLAAYRSKRLIELTDSEQKAITEIYWSFRPIIGPVGTAKGLHLIAPEFFIPWDSAIREGYGLADRRSDFWWFLKMTQEQIKTLGEETFSENPVKALDRFNFWHFKHNRATI